MAIIVQKPGMNFTCLTQFTKITKINLNAVKHAHLRLRPTGEQPSSAPWTPKGGLAGGSNGGLAAGPPLEATAPTSGRELTSSSKGGCRLRAGVQDKGLLEKSDWLTTSGVLVEMFHFRISSRGNLIGLVRLKVLPLRI